MTPNALEELHKTATTRLDNAEAELRRGAAELAELISQLTESPLKGRLRQRLFEAERRLDPALRYSSQAGQDRYLDGEVFAAKEGGVFVEVGAYDGLIGSNALFFERFRGWHGLLIEPSPRHAATARRFRSAPVLQVAAGGVPRRARFLDIEAGYTQMSGLAETYDSNLRARVEADPRFKGMEIEVEVRPLGDILREHGLTRVDYISLDVEGAEAEVIDAFPFEQITVTAWSVENNTGNSGPATRLRAAGYSLRAFVGVDEIWVKDA